MSKLFNWKNIQTFVRGCVEPHVVAMNTKFRSIFDTANRYIKIDYLARESLIDIGTVIIWPSPKPMPCQNWYLECNGQRYNTMQYPKLYEILGTDTVPNYNTYFLRGTTNVNTVGTTAQDTFKSHIHNAAAAASGGSHAHTTSISSHAHSFSGSTTKTTIKTTFVDYHTGINGVPVQYDPFGIITPIGGPRGADEVVYAVGDSNVKVLTIPVPALSVSGSTSSGGGGAFTSSYAPVKPSVSVTIAATGAAETAPKHAYVRFFIRAKHE